MPFLYISFNSSTYFFTTNSTTQKNKSTMEYCKTLHIFMSTPSKTPPEWRNLRKNSVIFTKTAPTPHFQHHPERHCRSGFDRIGGVSRHQCFFLLQFIPLIFSAKLSSFSGGNFAVLYFMFFIARHLCCISNLFSYMAYYPMTCIAFSNIYNSFVLTCV